MKELKNEPVNYPPDEFTGCGGSYSRDLITGKRTLIARTESLVETNAKASEANPATPAPSQPLATAPELAVVKANKK